MKKSTFRLISDRLVPRGPSFPNPYEMRIDASSQQVSMRVLSTHVWVAERGVPTIVRVDGALYTGGPVWSIQLASPVW